MTRTSARNHAAEVVSEGSRVFLDCRRAFADDLQVVLITTAPNVLPDPVAGWFRGNEVPNNAKNNGKVTVKISYMESVRGSLVRLSPIFVLFNEPKTPITSARTPLFSRSPSRRRYNKRELLHEM